MVDIIDIKYGFMCVRYEVTGLGHNDHGSFPTGVWHIELSAASETTEELSVAPGDMNEVPLARIAAALTALAARGWRAEETTPIARAFRDWRYENILIRVARASVAAS